MTRRFLALTGVVTLVFASFVSAQPPRLPDTLEGTWRSTVSPERARAVAMAAFEPRLESLPVFVRPMVRSRIEERMLPPTRLAIAIDGDRVRTESYRGEARAVLESALGETTVVRGHDGVERRATQRVRRGWLEQVFFGENGRVTRLLSTEPDGRRLHVDMTVNNERLGAPVRWRIDFTR